MPLTFSNPVVTALRKRDADPCPRLQVANGRFADSLPPGDAVLAAAVEAAWEPMTTGQPIPMIGEPVDAEPCFDD
jgi:hypothetical protein